MKQRSIPTKRRGALRHTRPASLWALAAGLTLALSALAQTTVAPATDAASPSTHRDPWVPPTVRAAALAAPPAPRAGGAALRAQVEARLQARFAAADVAGTGRLSAEQARAAGLGWLAERFDEVDTRREGRVSFEDVQRYLRARR